MTFDVCIIGHVTKDIIRFDNRPSRELPGGTAYYTAIALRTLGWNVAVVTKVALNDRASLLSEFEDRGIAVFCQESEVTHTFENSYTKDNPDGRCQKVTAVASPFRTFEMEPISAAYFHLGPLTKHDLSIELLRRLAESGSTISADVQGFVRNVVGGKVESCDWEEKSEGLSLINVLKASQSEARILSGEDDLEAAAIRLAGYGPKQIIVTLGSQGSLIYAGGKLYRIPTFIPQRKTDATGCGDTYVAGYLYQISHSHDIRKAGIFAAAMAALKLESFGPFRGDAAQVRALTESYSVRSAEAEFACSQSNPRG